MAEERVEIEARSEFGEAQEKAMVAVSPLCEDFDGDLRKFSSSELRDIAEKFVRYAAAKDVMASLDLEEF